MDTDIIIRVSVSEASRLFGVSQKTIRDAIKKQDIRYIVVQNRYKINFDSLVRWSQGNQRRKNKLNSSGIGKYVDTWKSTAVKYSPRPPVDNNSVNSAQ